MKNQKLSILHLIYKMGPGGLENVVRDITVYQKEKECEVTVVCLFDEGFRAEELRREGIEVIGLNLRQGLGMLNLTMPLWRICEAKNIDVLHVHTVGVEIAVALVVLISRIRKSIFTIHAPKYYSGLQLWRARLQAKIAGFCFRKIVAVGNALKEHEVSHIHRKPCDVMVICNGIDIDRFQPRTIESSSRAESLGLSFVEPGVFVVGTAVQLKGYKDIPTLIRAAARVKAKKGKEVLFVVAGTGPLEGELKALARELCVDDCLKFVGRIEDMPSFLNATDLFVLTSRFEGLPIIVIEAIATGLAVVTTDSIGVRDCIIDGQTGILVPVGDDKAVADAIIKLMEDRELARRMGQAGLAMARREFTIERQMQGYWDLITEELR